MILMIFCDFNDFNDFKKLEDLLNLLKSLKNHQNHQNQFNPEQDNHRWQRLRPNILKYEFFSLVLRPYTSSFLYDDQ